LFAAGKIVEAFGGKSVVSLRFRQAGGRLVANGILRRHETPQIVIATLSTPSR
jgi:hypothetical protein